MEPDRPTLEAAHCWERADVVPGRPQMTAFRRRLRYQQAMWREAKGHPIGSQPIVPKADKPSRPLGSRLPLDYARTTGANFLTGAAHAAVQARLARKESHQMLDAQRLWADLLSSTPMCFNLFGELAAVNSTPLLQVWLEHLLVLSMLQHDDGAWRWGRFVFVYPEGNSDLAEVCSQYRALLVDQSTFHAVTIEELLTTGALPKGPAAAFQDRYLPA